MRHPFRWWRDRKIRRAAQARRIEASRRQLRQAEQEHVIAAELAGDLRRRVAENRFAPMLVEAFRGPR